MESTETAYISADEEGFLYGSAQIFFFVLAVGAFITMTMETGAIQTGIGRLALRFRRSPAILVAVLMSVFALGGTSYGMWEETLGFFALLVPLVLALGYDRMVAASIIFLGAGTGVLASTVNPFATGVASDAAGISLSDGLGLRVLLLVVLVPMAIGYVLWYGGRVRKDPNRSLLQTHRVDLESLSEHGGEATEVPALTGIQKVTLAIFFGAFLIMIYGFIPWNDLWDTFFGAEFPLPTFESFYFTEASMLFLVAAVIIGVIAKLGEEGTVNTIVRGASDFLGAALVIVAARGITVVMRNTYITDTVLNWMEEGVSGTDAGVFAVARFPGEHPDRVPGAVVVGPRRAGHADPRPTGRLRRRRPVDRCHRLPVGVGVRELPHADRRGGHGRPDPRQGPLRPLSAVPAAVPGRRVRGRGDLHGHRWRCELRMRVVVALGGNALLRRGEPMTAENQRVNVALACDHLAPLAAEHELVVSHGNGPQIGLLALEGAAYEPVPVYPLDVLGAETQGMIGYLVEQELGNRLPFDKPIGDAADDDRGRPRRSRLRRPDQAHRSHLHRRAGGRARARRGAGRSGPTATRCGGWCRRRPRSASSSSVRSPGSSTPAAWSSAPAAAASPPRYGDGHSSTGSRP